MFQTIRRMHTSGIEVGQIANHLGINRRGIAKWAGLDTFPVRTRTEPRPGMAESFRYYLRRCWYAGIRHSRTLFATIQELCYCRAALQAWVDSPDQNDPVISRC